MAAWRWAPTEQIALVDADGQALWRRANPLADFRGQLHDQGIRVDRDGGRVAFGFRYGGAEPALFSVAEGRLTRLPGLEPEQAQEAGAG
jgi:hypothetical protein